MSLNIDYDDNNNSSVDYNLDDEEYDLNNIASEHKSDVRRKLEDRLERRRLKQELEDYEGELDGEFDWENLDR
ncbi:MAG: hypothetical protein Q8R83_01060 [Legionellaceae bacterium]|nr:hypothetical protein [Legionellaceae bacterium]